jgi:hypothetical protein
LVKEFNSALEAFVRVIDIAVGQDHAPALAITNSASIWKRSSSDASMVCLIVRKAALALFVSRPPARNVRKRTRCRPRRS